MQWDLKHRKIHTFTRDLFYFPKLPKGDLQRRKGSPSQGTSSVFQNSPKVIYKRESKLPLSNNFSIYLLPGLLKSNVLWRRRKRGKEMKMVSVYCCQTFCITDTPGMVVCCSHLCHFGKLAAVLSREQQLDYFCQCFVPLPPVQKERDPAEFNWKLSATAYIFSREWPPKAVTPWANHFLMFISGKQTNMAAHRRAQIQSSNVCSINIDRTVIWSIQVKIFPHFLFWGLFASSFWFSL